MVARLRQNFVTLSVPPKSVVESTRTMSPERWPVVFIQISGLYSGSPAAVKGCALSPSMR